MFNSYTHTHAQYNGDENFKGEDDTSNSGVYGNINWEKHNTKKSHTQRITLFITHRDIPRPMDTNLHY